MKFRFFRLGVALFVAMSAPALVGQTITRFDPVVGTTNDIIDIYGTGFLTGTPIVQFMDHKTATTYYVNSDTHMQVYVPAGAVYGELSVYRSGGTPIFSTNKFTMIGRGPYITSLSTNIAPTNTTISIYGVHLTNTTSVRFGGVSTTSYSINTDGRTITSVLVPSVTSNCYISVTTPYGSFTNSTLFTPVGSGPYIAGFTPNAGDNTTLVTISGWHFTSGGTPTVRFNGVAGAIQSLGDNVITVYPPSGVTTGPISVGRAGVGTNTTTAFFYASPSVTSLSPTNGIAGTTVTLTGQNFLGATSVQFGGVDASFTPPTSNTNLVAVVPAGASSGKIRVATPGGVQFSGTAFRILPTITGFSPGIGRTGTNVTINGANLNEGISSVKFNGTPVTSSLSGATFGQVTVAVPAAATTGPITLTTTNGTVSSITNFFLPPQITGFLPTNSAVGSTVTITGQNLLGTTAVSFNGTPATIVTPPTTNTLLQVFVPEGMTTGPISVTAPAGTTNSGSLLFYAPPVITSFSPTNGLPGAAVSIFGTNLTGATFVRFNGTNATFTPVNNGQINAVVPGTFNGPITVIAPAGSATSSVPFMISSTSDVGVTISASPDLVFVGSNLVYTITVTNKGPYAAPFVSLTNTLPGSVNLKAATTTQGSLNTNSNPIIASLSTIPVSGFAKITLTVVPQSIGIIMDSVSVGSAYTDPVSVNNASFVATTVYSVPSLSIQLYSPTLVQISWPLDLTDFNLEYKTDLASTNSWFNVSNQPMPVGDQKVVIDPIGTTPKFYRLKR